MFKRLELIGFKSLADKTRFDFARGITAVLARRLGKSNIADADKWIFGEQSAKSRGPRTIPTFCEPFWDRWEKEPIDSQLSICNHRMRVQS